MTATTCGSPREIERHEQRARDRVAVEIELPVVGAAARAEARAAELLAEHRELGDIEFGTGEHAAPVGAGARVGSVSAVAARQREPIVDLEQRQAAVQRHAAVGAKLGQRAAELQRRAAELERRAYRRAWRRSRARTGASRRDSRSIARPPSRERHVELEVRRLARRLRERLGKAQRDTGKIRRDGDLARASSARPQRPAAATCPANASGPRAARRAAS